MLLWQGEHILLLTPAQVGGAGSGLGKRTDDRQMTDVHFPGTLLCVQLWAPTHSPACPGLCTSYPALTPSGNGARLQNRKVPSYNQCVSKGMRVCVHTCDHA
jgi:hypothetical protein